MHTIALNGKRICIEEIYVEYPSDFAATAVPENLHTRARLYCAKRLELVVRILCGSSQLPAAHGLFSSAWEM
jgi:hypothetical protein